MFENAPRWMCVFVIAMALGACGETPVENSDRTQCEAARDHVASCFPEREIEPDDSCNTELASATLQRSCEELASEQPADGYCNPWLWWTCLGSADSGSDDSSGDDSRAEDYRWTDTSDVDIRVSIRACYSEICGTVTGGMPCTLAVLEDSEGNEVSREFANRYSSVHFDELELEDGEYFIKIYRRDGTLAESIHQPEFSFNHSESRDMVISFTVAGRDLEIDEDRYVSMEERERLSRCSKVGGTIESTCQGAPMSAEETEWAWFVRIEGPEVDGKSVDYLRPFETRGQNRFTFGQVTPGTYEITFLEMDVPSYRQRNNPDYERLVRYYATGRELRAEDVEVELRDAEGRVEIGHYELDHSECR